MSAADPTRQEMLTAVNAAIYAILTGGYKSLSASERSLTKLGISELRDIRRELVRELRSTENTVSLGDVSGS
ncbi:MAG TPA: peptidylprolyl isomerase [Planctomycetes bacterium]|nr:peptidylprolyl isomerase [Planctomycetota bacterium]